MGAWGIKTFENDDSSDWLYELQESKDLSVVELALNQSNSDYIEAPEACNIIAASEIVLALLGSARVGLPENAELWAQKNKSLDASYLKSKAIEALASVLSERSELNELWQEAKEDYEAWVSDVKQLQSAITAS